MLVSGGPFLNLGGPVFQHTFKIFYKNDLRKYLWKLVHWSLERESMADDCASCEAAAHSRAYAADVIFIGLILSMVFLLVMFLMLFTPKCDPNTCRLARIPGIWLLLGAIMYLVGWIWWIIADRIVLEYDQLSSEEQTEKDAEC